MTKPDNVESIKRTKKTSATQHIESDVEVKGFAVKISTDIIDKVNDFCYWEGVSQSDVAIMALEEFFKKRDVKPMPDQVRKRMEENANRRKRGINKK